MGQCGVQLAYALSRLPRFNVAQFGQLKVRTVLLLHKCALGQDKYVNIRLLPDWSSVFVVFSTFHCVQAGKCLYDFRA